MVNAPVVALQEVRDERLGRVPVDFFLRGADVEHAVERAADLVDVAALVAQEDRALVDDRRTAIEWSQSSFSNDGTHKRSVRKNEPFGGAFAFLELVLLAKAAEHLDTRRLRGCARSESRKQCGQRRRRSRRRDSAHCHLALAAVHSPVRLVPALTLLATRPLLMKQSTAARYTCTSRRSTKARRRSNT